MSLITEDGTSLPNSESYISVTDADGYFSDRGTLSWSTMLTAEKEQALRRATDFMMGRYRGRWKGGRVHAHQALDWPRQGVTMEDMNGAQAPYYAFLVDYQTVPIEVKRACAELALRAAAGPLLPDEQPRVAAEQIGPIRITYDMQSPNHIRYGQIDEMLSVYLSRGGNGAMTKMVRS